MANPTPAAIVEVFKAADAVTGHMSLQHDTISFSVDLVPELIATIKAKGMTFVTADKCGTVPAYREGGVTPGIVAAAAAAAPGTNSTQSGGASGTTSTIRTGGSPRQASGAASLFSSAYLGVAAMAVAAILRM